MSAADDAPLKTPESPVIGIVCALSLEVGPLIARCRQHLTDSGNGLKFHGLSLGKTRIVLVQGGMGMRRAELATHALIDGHQPSWVISLGFSGALVPDLPVGDIVLGTEIVSADHSTRISIDVRTPAATGPGWRAGKLCVAGEIVRTITEKQELAARTGAVAVDMESLAVARACAERRVRCLVIRAISDDLQHDLPREAVAILGSKGTIRAGALLKSLVTRPGCVKDLWELREKSLLAAENLGKFTVGAIQELAAAKPA